VTADRGWKRPFDETIPLPRGRQLVTFVGAATRRNFRREKRTALSGKPRT